MCHDLSYSWPGHRVVKALWVKARKSFRNRPSNLRASVGIASPPFIDVGGLGDGVLALLGGPWERLSRLKQILRQDLPILGHELAQVNLGLSCFRVAVHEGEQ